MTQRHTAAALAAAAVLVLGACGGDDESSAATTAATAATATTAPGSDASAATSPLAPGELWEDPSGTFRIAFPAEPRVQNVQAPLPDGTSLPVTAYLTEIAGAAAIASCVIYPDDTAIDEATVLDSARDGALANIGAELVDSEPIELQGRLGVSYRGAIGEAGGVLARTYLDGLQLCQVLVVGEPTVVEDAAPPILDSFAFVKETA
jgi:FAD/FMN-containing dehydrogenase